MVRFESICTAKPSLEGTKSRRHLSKVPDPRPSQMDPEVEAEAEAEDHRDAEENLTNPLLAPKDFRKENFTNALYARNVDNKAIGPEHAPILQMSTQSRGWLQHRPISTLAS